MYKLYDRAELSFCLGLQSRRHGQMYHRFDLSSQRSAKTTMTASDPARPQLPWLFSIRSHPATILAVIVVAFCTDAVLYSVIVPVLPFSLHTRLQIPDEQIQTYISLLLGTYALGIIVFSPICGYFADRSSSRKRPFMLAFLVLAAANAALCFGERLEILFLGRLLQGAASAVVWAVGYAMVPETLSSEKAGVGIGWVTMGAGSGLLIGPTAGGLVYDRWGYYAVFYMSFILLAIDVLFRAFMIERRSAERLQARINKWEISKNAGRAEETDALIREHDAGFQKSVKRAHRFPLWLLLTTPRFSSALLGITVLGMMLTAFDGVLPLFVHRTFDWGPSQAGLIFLVIAVSCLLDPIFGQLSDKHGPRLLTLSSLLLAIPAFVLLSYIHVNDTLQKVLMSVALLVVGICVCMGITPLNAECSAIVDEYKRTRPGVFGEGGAFAQCFSLATVAYGLGFFLGPIIAGWIIDNFGWQAMNLSMAGLSALTAVPTVRFSHMIRRARTDQSSTFIAEES